MADRLVHLIDSDPALAKQISAALEPYGLRLIAFPDGNEALAQKEVPALTILCIDPKRLGWAICNRMKKSASLKMVPLIVISAEASEKDFEDHKQLKNRAEDYLHKPFAIEALVERVSTQLGGLEPLGGEVEIPIGDEMQIEEDDVDVDVDLDEPIVAHAPHDDFGGRTTVQALDGLIDRDTDEAFEALEAGGLPEGAATLTPIEMPPMEMASLADLPRLPPRLLTPIAERITVTPPPPPAEAIPPELDLGLDDELAAKVRESSRVERSPWPDGETARLREEIGKLQRELDDARAHKSEGSSASTFSREREFLNLREVINKKEKELLDLRDAVDARDRLLLDVKDKVREGERTRRDLEEKLLVFEKDAVTARERAEALTRDKETGLQREKGLKARVDEAQKKLDRAFAEIDDRKAKHAAEVEAAAKGAEEAVKQAEVARREMVLEKAAHDQAAAAAEARFTASLEAREGELAERHAEEKNSIAAAHEKARLEALSAQAAATAEQTAAGLDSLTRAHSDAVKQKEEAHSEALAAARVGQEERMVVAIDRAREQLSAMEERHRGAEQAAAARHAEELARKETEHRQQLAAAQSDHRNEVDGLHRTHEAAMLALEEQRKALENIFEKERGALEGALAAEKRGASELAATVERLRLEHQAALEASAQAHAARQEEFVAAHAREKEALAVEHAGERAALLAAQAHALEAARVEAAERIDVERRAHGETTERLTHAADRVIALEEELAAAREQALAMTSDLAATTDHLASRDRKLAERVARIAELETESARLQEQVLAAIQRIKNNELIVARARTALAIALTLLDAESALDAQLPPDAHKPS